LQIGTMEIEAAVFPGGYFVKVGCPNLDARDFGIIEGISIFISLDEIVIFI
jgi:hypothetical protein